MIIVSIITILVAVLQIALLYKIWMMTNDVKDINLTIKAKECRELGLPRKAKLKKRNGKEVDAYSVENGQILCAVNDGGNEYSDTFDYNDIELQ